MKKLGKFFLSLSLVLFLAGVWGMSEASAQVKLHGSQIKGTAGSNAQLKCQPITIQRPMKVVSVTGNNKGFWIVKGTTTIKRYWNQNDRAVVGLVLKPGKYYIYPNLKRGQTRADVTLNLQ